MSSTSPVQDVPLSDTHQNDRFCDLVMKGGIASGIVYPLAVAKLCEKYRFRSIGGTSAGAVAAAVTAAAEYRRRTTGSMAGFELLRDMPAYLRDIPNPVKAGPASSSGAAPVTAGASAPDGSSATRYEAGVSRLKGLFQPNAGCERLYGALLSALNRATWKARFAMLAKGLAKAYLAATMVALFVGVGVAILIGANLAQTIGPVVGGLIAIVLGAVVALLVAVAGIALHAYRDVTTHVIGNGYGLCNGMQARNDDFEAITPWMHRLIQQAAGIPVEGDPLTFGQLWRAVRGPVESRPDDPDYRSIDLQMFATNLAHGRPYVLPHVDKQVRLFYRPSELAPLVPPEVMEWMIGHSAPYAPPQDGDRGATDDPTERWLELPSAKDFPVALAARMSLSFPLLFSAIPLWAIDRSDPGGPLRKCWFSDGGIASNFPLHLFDSFLPLWPTFGIQLDKKVAPDDRPFLPRRYDQGYDDTWNAFDEKATQAERFGGFFLSVFSAAQNWNDNTLARMPGFRDRVVRVPLGEKEGGFNLDMPGETQESVAQSGADAADELIDCFLGSDPAKPSAGWDAQRWVRLDVLIRLLNQRLPGVQSALGNVPHATSYTDLLLRALNAPPIGHAQELSPEQADALKEYLTLLRDSSVSAAGLASKYSHVPIPEPALRVRPPL